MSTEQYESPEHDEDNGQPAAGLEDWCPEVGAERDEDDDFGPAEHEGPIFPPGLIGRGKRGETQSMGQLFSREFMDYLKKMGEQAEELRKQGCQRERDGVRCGQPVPAPAHSPPANALEWRARQGSADFFSPITKALQRRLPFDRGDRAPRIPAERWWSGYLCAECEVDAVREIDAAHRGRLARYLERLDAQLPYMFRWARPKAPEVEQRIPLRARREAVAVLPKMLTREPEVATLTLAGPAGTGKTSLAIVLLRHLYAMALESELDSDVVRIACGAKFVSCWDLSGEGTEKGTPEAVFRSVVNAPLVVLDDLGAERHGVDTVFKDLISKLIHARFHRGASPPLPMWITTGLDELAAGRLYGGGVGRRIYTDDGGLVRVVRFEPKQTARAA
ncbi:hypothetical protein WMF30_40255 [Sorangium sp. So ce134]